MATRSREPNREPSEADASDAGRRTQTTHPARRLVERRQATSRDGWNVPSKQRVAGSNPAGRAHEVFTFGWGSFSRLGLKFRAGWWSWPGPGWFQGAVGAFSAVLGFCLACEGMLAPPCGAGDRGGGAGEGGCRGGAAADMAGFLRRRRRVFGGRPLAARRPFSSWRAFQAARMRWLRTASSAVVNSMSGARPVRRHQPRLMVLVAGSLAVAKPRSAPLRRA